ncbi:MAG: sugar ABC transporter substrate-binding protein [Methanomassiliicoccales archaeon]|nr:sugar ABC transporter substrate-binding protein [Methanomassiliicoccales archaeon]
MWVPEVYQILDEAIAAFEAQHPGVTITRTEVTWGDLRSQLMISLATGTAPDIVIYATPWIPELVNMHAIVDISPYLPSGFLEIFLPSALKVLQQGDVVWGLPWEGSTWGFFYRKDLFSEAGLDPERPPSNWAELVEFASRLTQNGRYGLGFPAAGWEPDDYFLPFLWQAGGEVAVCDPTGCKATLDTNEARTAVQFYYDLIHTYKVVPPTVVGWDWESTVKAFVAGDIAMMYNGLWAAGTIDSIAPELQGKWSGALNPSGPAGCVHLGYPNALIVTSQSLHPALAVEFIISLHQGDPSYLDRICLALNSLNWTRKFAETAYLDAPQLRPLVDAMHFSRSRPAFPQYETFRQTTFNPGLQALILKKLDVGQAVEQWQTMLDRLFGQ